MRPFVVGVPGGLLAAAADVRNEEELGDFGVGEGRGDEVLSSYFVDCLGACWAAFSTGAWFFLALVHRFGCGGHTSRPNDAIRLDTVDDTLCIGLCLHIVKTGEKDVEGALLALPQSADFRLVVGVADDAGDVPGAREEKGSQVEGDFAVATEEKNVHFGVCTKYNILVV